MSNISNINDVAMLYNPPDQHGFKQVLGVSATSFAAVIALMLYYYFFHPFAKIPGPFLAAVSPLWMMKAVYGKKLNRDIIKIHNKYGSVVRIGPNYISFATVEAQNTIHNSKSSGEGHFTKHGTVEWLLGHMAWPAPNILTTTDVETHKRLRKTIQPAFTAKELRKQEPILRKWLDTWIVSWDKAASEGRDINITESISHLVWDLLGDLAFGEPLPRSQLAKFNRLKSLACSMSPLIEAMQSILSFPILGPFIQWLVVTFPQIFRLPRDILPSGTLRATLAREDRGHDFLSAIVDVEKKGVALSPAELQSNSAMLVMVGQDATVTCLSSTLYYLLRDPSKMARLQAEIRQAPFKTIDDITGESIAQLPYLNGALQEAMRLLSPSNGTGTHRTSYGAHVDGIYVPPGASVAVDPFTIQRSPKYWAEAGQYCPERWFENYPGSKFEHDNLAASKPFLLGARVCLGRELAMQIARLILAQLAFRYDFEMTNKDTFIWERDCDSSYLWLGHKVMVRLVEH